MPRLLHLPMRARDTDEPHRSASPLELLFDLTFVVAVATLVFQLAHAIVAGTAVEHAGPFLLVFFAIWWAWMNFTWFASAYDTDDAVYRILVVVQIAGVLVVAAGVPAAFGEGDFVAITIGYVVMRVSQLALWIRAAVEHRESRATALRYAGAITILQVAWVLRMLLPEPWVLVVSLALGVLELVTPIWAERTAGTTWHPHHIAERYGLFFIILLGESVLAAVNGVQSAIAASGVTWPLVGVALAGLVLIVGLWWAYFLQPAGAGLARRRRRSFVWGYGHYFLFVAVAAVGAGLEAAVEAASHSVEAADTFIGYAVALPAALALVLIWALHAPLLGRTEFPAVVAVPAAVVVLAAPLAAPVIGVVGVTAAIALVVAAAVAVSHVAAAPWRR